MNFDFKKEILNIMRLSLEGKRIELLKEMEVFQNEIFSLGDSKFASEINELRSKNNFLIKSSFSEKDQFENLMPEKLKQYFEITILNNDYEKAIKSLLFYGKPGIGKTESAKWISKKLNRELHYISIENILSPMLGESTKKLKREFEQVKPGSIILFDEIDSVVTNRFTNEDIGEIKRITISMLSIIENDLNDNLFIAITNKIDQLDPAFLRRMDDIIELEEFYSKEDYVKISKWFMGDFDKKFINFISERTYELNFSPSEIIRLSKQLSKIKNDKELMIQKIIKTLIFESENDLYSKLKKDYKLSYTEMQNIFGTSRHKISRGLKQ